MANPRTIARLQERIKERAAYCLQFELSDPRASFLTVTRVKLSPDLSSGRIYYSVLGTEADKSKAEHMLRSAAGFIQRQVARVLEMRRMPHLSWSYDDSAEHAADMDQLIREARARDITINPALADEPPVVPAKDPGGREALDEAAAQAPTGSLPLEGELEDEFVDEWADEDPQ